MHELTSLEIGILVRELKQLEGSRIRKFYDLGNGAFKIAFYKSPDTKLVYIRLMKTMNLTEFSEAAGGATQFAMAVRKRAENSVVDKIQQVNLDRIVRFELDKGKRSMVLEMYGKGNLFLMDGSSTIETVYKTVVQKGRELKKGATYSPPANASRSIFDIGEEEARSIAGGLAVEKSLIGSLSGVLNLGPIYLEDIITDAGLDPMDTGISEAQCGKLADSILEFSKRLASEKPRIYMKNGEAVEYAACSVSKFGGLETKEFGSMSQLLDELYLTDRTSVPDTSRQERLKELTLNIEKQEQLTAQLATDSVNYAVYGKAIMQNMNRINELCDYLREHRRATLEEIRDKFPGLGIKGLDLKNKTVNIELGE